MQICVKYFLSSNICQIEYRKINKFQNERFRLLCYTCVCFDFVENKLTILEFPFF